MVCSWLLKLECWPASPRAQFLSWVEYSLFGSHRRRVHQVEQAEQTEGRWVLPESLRIKGELLLLQAADGATAAADDHFRQAVKWARRQGELSWELRAATSLARLLRNQGRLADAIACLQPVYDRFIEGFDTADLIAAKRLLNELGNAGHD